MAFKLNEVIPWGRSFDEYQRMFALSDEDLAGRILGCGDGPASFNAEATAKGHAVVSCDPIYAFSPGEIEQRVKDCYDDVIAQVHTNRDGFVWDYFHGPDHLGECRLKAMQRFLEDFDQGKAERRYVTASLPGLNFKDGEFDLALVSHLSSTPSNWISTSIWRRSRSCCGWRTRFAIFPLQTLGGRQSPHVEPISTICAKEGFTAEIRLVAYEFQRGGNKVLHIERKQHPAPSG